MQASISQSSRQKIHFSARSHVGLLTTFVKKVFRKKLGQDGRGPALAAKEMSNFTSVTERPLRLTEFWKTSNLWKNSSAVKNSQEIGRDISRSTRLFGALQSTISCWKSISACQGYCHMIRGATLFSKVMCNKLRVKTENKIMLIWTKFCVDLIFNTSEVTTSGAAAYSYELGESPAFLSPRILSSFFFFSPPFPFLPSP